MLTTKRVRSRSVVWLALLSLVALGIGSSASGQSKEAVGGIVSGHVVFADNDMPARFATIYLKSVAPPDLQDDFFSVLMDSAIINMQKKSQNGSATTSGDERELNMARSAAKGFLSNVSDSMLSATIGADGEYTFTGVPAGSYFVHVKAHGYIDPLTEFSSDEIGSHDPAIMKKIADVVTIVSISGTQQIGVDMRLDRGASITGRVNYDDGSPATGWTVRAIARHAVDSDQPASVLGIDLSQLSVSKSQDRTVTDDRGYFRIAGLPTGKYILEAKLTTAAMDRQPFSPVSSSAGSFLSILGGLSGMSGFRVAVYSGNVTRVHDAEEISVRASEERPGADLVVSLGSAHSITGIVVSKTDSHPVNDGKVELVAQDRNGKDDPSLTMSASIHSDGTFRFDYVPAPGSYTLRSIHAADSSVTSTMKLLGSVIAEHSTQHSYGSASTTITLHDEDITAVRLSVE